MKNGSVAWDFTRQPGARLEPTTSRAAVASAARHRFSFHAYFGEKLFSKSSANKRKQPQNAAECQHSALLGAPKLPSAGGRIGMLELRTCKNVGNIGNIGYIVVHQQLKVQQIGNRTATSA